MNLKKISSFKIFDDFIIINSNSGNTYRLTKNTCSCKGFGFHRSCSHFKEATENGLIDLIGKNHPEAFDIRKNPTVIKARKQALKLFLEKNSIKTTQQLIEKIEPLITSKTTPLEVLQLAH
jgi:hypothetical protein